ncbi:DUF4200 domain-containing protein [Lewinella sp. W8]|uniref:DUF4200 domain-containing protein n=1 Tax=Lewinella sp. W8 TaxID=2528208 RepID=UPI001067AB6D|nr:DUF4200 domain-containing protein [Lewinella sp. W8]MTB49571.1 hypothetical protein [Lewinella sp. W8]
MKDLFFSFAFLCLLLLAGSQVVTAQVTNQTMTMSRGTNEALILELPSADDKMVAKLWPDWLKDTYKVKTKKNRKTKEMESLNFLIPGVSAGGKVDMYSDIKGAGTGSELIVWIATPDGYISPNMDVSRYVEAEKMLMRFALEVGREQLRLEVEEEEKALKELEKELDRLKKDKEKFEKVIRDAEKAIEDARADIERNIDAQANKEKEIGAQIEAVETIKRKLKDF